jgi:hypothetical protein
MLAQALRMSQDTTRRALGSLLRPLFPFWEPLSLPRLNRTWTVGQAEDRPAPLGMDTAHSGLCIRATHSEPVSSGSPFQKPSPLAAPILMLNQPIGA